MDTPLSRWNLPFKGPGVGRDQLSWGAVSTPGLACRVGSLSRGAWGGAKGTWSLVGLARALIWKDVDSWKAKMEGGGVAFLRESDTKPLIFQTHHLGILLQEALPALFLVPTPSPGPPLAVPDPLPFKRHPGFPRRSSS